MRHSYKKRYKNVLIRQLEKQDLELIREWRNNPDNTRFLRKLPYITREMQSEWFKKYLENQKEMMFAIEETKSLHRLVGSMALYNFKDSYAEFGKILIGDDQAHGKQVGVNAITAILDIAYKELNINIVYLHVFSENISAINIYKRVGFMQEDLKYIDGTRELVMSINKNDFFGRKDNV